MSHFYAYISKLKWILRWGLKRNAVKENVAEHSWEVATIAHALAIIRNTRFGGCVDAHAIATAALYHDASEVLTGDLPSPIKYKSPSIMNAYKAIEAEAEQKLLALLPEDLRPAYGDVLIEHRWPPEHQVIIKAADTISAYLKCQAELQAGNPEFSKAAEDVAARLREMALPEADVFMDLFAPGYALTLVEIL